MTGGTNCRHHRGNLIAVVVAVVRPKEREVIMGSDTRVCSPEFNRGARHTTIRDAAGRIPRMPRRCRRSGVVTFERNYGAACMRSAATRHPPTTTERSLGSDPKSRPQVQLGNNRAQPGVRPQVQLGNNRAQPGVRPQVQLGNNRAQPGATAWGQTPSPARQQPSPAWGQTPSRARQTRAGWPSHTNDHGTEVADRIIGPRLSAVTCAC